MESSYSEMAVLDNHKGKIYKIITLSENSSSDRFASCSTDRTIKIWNIYHPFDLLVSLPCPCDGIRSIIQLTNTNIILASSDNCTINKIDIFSQTCLGIVKMIGYLSLQEMIELKNGKIAVGCALIRIIVIVDINKMVEETYIYGDNLFDEDVGGNWSWNGAFSFARLKNNYILCGTCGGGILIFEEERFSIQTTKNNVYSFNQEITNIQIISDEMFLTVSSKRNFNFWKYKMLNHK